MSPSSFAAAVDCNLVFCFTFLLENGCVQLYCNTCLSHSHIVYFWKKLLDLSNFSENPDLLASK